MDVKLAIFDGEGVLYSYKKVIKIFLKSKKFPLIFHTYLSRFHPFLPLNLFGKTGFSTAFLSSLLDATIISGYFS
jgi:hypothetical protein